MELQKYGLDLEIVVEGGINPKNAGALKRAGSDILILGKDLFESKDYSAFITCIRNV